MAEQVERATDLTELRHQYGTDERLRIRSEAHQRFSERPQDFFGWVVDQLQILTGQVVLDGGCGYGNYHPELARRGARLIVGLDPSGGMLQSTRRQARQQQLLVQPVQGDLAQLPFRDHAFGAAMANHVLYHVRDQLLALRELRRVTRPGGRVVLATNSATSYAPLTEMHAQAARQLGYQPAAGPATRFNLDDHLGLVRQVFPDATVLVLEDALVFPSSHEALRYYASGMMDGIQDPPADDHHRADLLALVARQVEAVVARDGRFRVPKGTGCFVATA